MAHAGALATLTAEEYPGLTDFFVQVWEGSSDDSKVIFRAYGNSPEEARNRADLGADVLNVHEATGLTPSQLLQKTGGSTATAPITRLDWLGEEGMKEFDDGEYVFYADHQQTVAQLQARVAELEAALRTVLVCAECHADFSNGVVCPNTGADEGEATASGILRECRAVLERKA